MLAAVVLFAVGASGAPPAPPDMTVTPSSQDFGTLCVGATASRSFSINNAAGSDPLEIASITRSQGSDRFTPEDVSTPPPIPGGGSESFDVTFTAPSHGEVSATYAVIAQNVNDTDEVDVKGRGVDRRLTADRSTVSFGDQRVGTRSPTQNLIFRNSGADTVTVSAAKKTGANNSDFRITTPATPFTVSPGNFATVSIAFQPSASGLRTASLELTSNACGSTKVKVSLVGTGVVSKVLVDPNPIDVGTSAKDLQGPATAVTVANGGGAPLKITAVQVLGTDAADFLLEGLPTMPTTVAAGDSFIFNVRMTPSEEGARVATITILSDDPTTPEFSVDVKGTGTKASPSPTASASASASPSSSPTSTISTEPRALGAPNDGLAIILVIVAVLLAFGGLIVIRRFIAVPDDEA